MAEHTLPFPYGPAHDAVLDCTVLAEQVVRAVARALADNPLGFADAVEGLGVTGDDEHLNDVMGQLDPAIYRPRLAPADAADLTSRLARYAAQHHTPKGAAA